MYCTCSVGEETKECSGQSDVHQTPSKCSTADELSTNGQHGTTPSNLPTESSKSSLFTIANLLSSVSGQGMRGQLNIPTYTQSGAVEKAGTDVGCNGNDSLGCCGGPTDVGGEEIADNEGMNAEASRGILGVARKDKQVLKSKR